MRTKLLFNVLIVAALIGAGCAESDTFSDGLLPVDTTPPTEPVTMVVETPNPMDMVFNEVGDLVVKVTYADSGLAAAERPVFFLCVAHRLMLSSCSSRCYRREWSRGCSSIVWRDSNKLRCPREDSPK